MAGPVLIIDSDEIERRLLSRLLKNGCFQVIEAATGVEGLFRVLDEAPVLVLLAEEVPPLEATDLVTVIHRLTGVPVIVIGGGGDPDEIEALDNGADFYVRRPLKGRVLLARVRSLLRRNAGASAHTNGLTVSTTRLTRTEQRLMVCLAAEGGRPVPARRLAAAVWGRDSSLDAVKFYVWRLRRKLGPASSLSIDVLRGVGYRLRRTEAPSSEELTAI